MNPVRVIALGSRTACDDEAALLAAQGLEDRAEVILAGRPGPGLVDLLDPDRPTVLVDVVQAGLPPGQLITAGLAELPDAVLGGHHVSSHGLGPAEALRLGRTLGRRLPRGTFVGIQGQCLRPGEGMSAAVQRALPALTDAIGAAVAALSARASKGEPDHA